MNDLSLQLATGRDIPVQEAGGFSAVTLRHLRTPAEIERVLPLREGIDLSAHLSAGQVFHDLEKKETNWGSSARSSSTAN